MSVEVSHIIGFGVGIVTAFLAGAVFWQGLPNLAALVILWLCPRFKVGDHIIIKGESGRVTKVGWFATYLETPDRCQLSFPHMFLSGSTVKNLSRHSTRRVEVAAEIGDVPLGEARNILVAAAHSVDEILEEPGPAAVLVKVGSSSSYWKMRVWVKTEHVRQAEEALLESVRHFINCSQAFTCQNVRLSRSSLSA